MRAAEEFPWPVNDIQQAIKQHAVMCRELDRLRAVKAAALAYVHSDPPRPEWRTLCEALGVDWRQP